MRAPLPPWLADFLVTVIDLLVQEESEGTLGLLRLQNTKLRLREDGGFAPGPGCLLCLSDVLAPVVTGAAGGPRTGQDLESPGG